MDTMYARACVCVCVCVCVCFVVVFVPKKANEKCTLIDFAAKPLHNERITKYLLIR